MDGEKFDDLLKKVCTTRLTRLSALRGLAVAAVAAVTGSAFVADDAVAGRKKKNKKKRTRSSHQVIKPCDGGTQRKHLGESCGSTQCCVASEHLVCEKVNQTGAHRCECDLHGGFISCGGECRSTANCPPGTTPTCVNGQVTCPCPSGQLCGGQCLVACSGGMVRDPNTCQCVCPVVNGDPGQFCGGACHYESECTAQYRNRVLNVECCNQGLPCQNPGQPSGNCKRQ